MPRFMLLLHGDADSEAGKMPSKDILQQMHNYNAEIVASGNLLGAEGLHSTSKGARVSFPPPGDSAKDATVTKGPFEYPYTNIEGQNGESKRPMCGFWIIKAKDLDEAVGWVKKGPMAGTYVEVREVFESCDIPEFTDEMREQEASWRKDIEANKEAAST